MIGVTLRHIPCFHGVVPPLTQAFHVDRHYLINLWATNLCTGQPKQSKKLQISEVYSITFSIYSSDKITPSKWKLRDLANAKNDRICSKLRRSVGSA